MKRKLAVFALLSCAGLLVGISPAGAADGVLRASPMNGAKEVTGAGVPNQGDPDATGSATIFVDDDTNQVCLLMRWRNVDGTLSGLHIHLAPPTTNGPIVVGFTTPPTTASGSGFTFQCVGEEAIPPAAGDKEALLDDLVANPEDYYLNLHSTPNFGPGAIRSQLRGLF